MRDQGTIASIASRIPQIIHQTWKDESIPDSWLDLQASWKRHHPRWEYRLWVDGDLRELIRVDYSWFLPIYDAYPEHITRVDAARYFIMHKYGGLYVDLDFESLRSIEPLLGESAVVAGLEPASHVSHPLARERGLNKIVCNALLASRPAHAFWEHVFEQLVASRHLPGPLDAAGPFLLTRAVCSYAQPSDIMLVPAELVYPISNEESWNGRLDDAGIRAQLSRTAFAIHHWHGTWVRDDNSVGER